MARPGVTYFEVAQAAEQLQADLQTPTIDRVRRKLGSGSNSTIAAHLKQWKAENMPFTSDVPKSTVPPALLAQIQSLWDSLKETAQAQWDQARVELLQQLEQVQRDTAEQAKVLNTERQAHRDQCQRTDALTRQLGELSDQHEELTRAHAALQIRFQEQQQRLHEKTEHVRDLKTQLQHVGDNLDHFREATQRQREEEALKHESETYRLQQALKELQRQVADERDRHQAILIENEKRDASYQQQLTQNQWLAQQLDEKTQAVRELQSQLKALETQRADDSARQWTLQERLEQQQDHRVDLEKQLAAAEGKIHQLTAVNGLQEQRLEYLQHEQLHSDAENRRLHEAVKTMEQQLTKK